MLLLVFLISDRVDYIKYDNNLNILSFRYRWCLFSACRKVTLYHTICFHECIEGGEVHWCVTPEQEQSPLRNSAVQMLFSLIFLALQ